MHHAVCHGHLVSSEQVTSGERIRRKTTVIGESIAMVLKTTTDTEVIRDIILGPDVESRLRHDNRTFTGNLVRRAIGIKVTDDRGKLCPPRPLLFLPPFVHGKARLVFQPLPSLSPIFLRNLSRY